MVASRVEMLVGLMVVKMVDEMVDEMAALKAESTVDLRVVTMVS